MTNTTIERTLGRRLLRLVQPQCFWFGNPAGHTRRMAARRGLRQRFGTWLTASALCACATAATATEYGFVQRGFPNGGVAQGNFTAADLDADGQINSFMNEVTAFDMEFTGNGEVSAFTLGFDAFYGLVYDLDGGQLGDGDGQDDRTAEGIGVDDGVFSYNAGPGPTDTCGTGRECGLVAMDDLISGSSEFVVIIVGGLKSDSTTRAPSSEVATAGLQSQTAGLLPGITGQRAVGQAFRQHNRGSYAPGDSAALGRSIADSGLSAGDESDLAVGTWLSYTHSEVENDFSTVAFNSDISSLVGGADMLLGDSLVVGVAFGYENQDTDTLFNRGKMESRNYSVIPYVGYLINDNLSADVSVGHTWMDIDQSRSAGPLVFDSDVDSRRVFAAGNLTATKSAGNLLFSGGVGFLYARDRLDPFQESVRGVAGTAIPNSSSTVRLTQLRIGGSMSGYFSGWEPYVTAFYVRDISSTPVQVAAGQAAPADDDDEFQIGAGLRYFSEEYGITAAADITTVQSRESTDAHSVNLTFRMDL